MRLPLILSLIASSCAAGERPWAQARQVEADLDGLASVPVPAAWKRDEGPDPTGDAASFGFYQIYKGSWAGQYSFSQRLRITVVAPDLPAGAPERGRLLTLPRGVEPVRREREGEVEWVIGRFLYDRAEVKLPAWQILAGDAAAGVYLDWSGFEKLGSLTQEMDNLRALRAALRLRTTREAYFAQHRDWTADWPERLVENRAASDRALAAAGLPAAPLGAWAGYGPWRVAIDEERPQRLWLVRLLGGQRLPSGPVGLREPITLFRNWQGVWVQLTEGAGGMEVPASLAQGLQGEFTDRESTYFTAVQALPLWVRQEEIGGWVRRAVAMSDRMAAELAAGRAYGERP